MSTNNETNGSNGTKKIVRKRIEKPPIPLELLYRIGVVRASGHKKGTFYAAKLFKARYRRDGIITYRPIRQVSDAYLDYYRAKVEGEERCPGITFDKNVKLGCAVYLPKDDPTDFEN